MPVANHRFGGHVKRFFAGVGPGVITGAADDDPSGIATYSVTGLHSDTVRCGRRSCLCR
jgi:Mn2+/Fe2+ NRAMP family transporter